MVNYKCTFCGCSLSSPESLLGKEAKCLYCGRMNTVVIRGRPVRMMAAMPITAKGIKIPEYVSLKALAILCFISGIVNFIGVFLLVPPSSSGAFIAVCVFGSILSTFFLWAAGSGLMALRDIARNSFYAKKSYYNQK